MKRRSVADYTMTAAIVLLLLAGFFTILLFRTSILSNLSESEVFRKSSIVSLASVSSQQIDVPSANYNGGVIPGISGGKFTTKDIMAAGYGGTFKCGEVYIPENNNGHAVAIAGGHLGHDLGPGSPTTGADCLCGIPEHTAMYDISVELAAQLRNAGFITYLIRHTDNAAEYPFSNAHRAIAANDQKVEMVLYLHWDGIASGVSSWVIEYMDPSKYPQDLCKKSEKYASLLAKNYLVDVPNISFSIYSNRCTGKGYGPNGAISGGLACMSNASVPVCLFELGNSKNKGDCQFLHSPEGIKTVSQSITKATLEYFN